MLGQNFWRRRLRLSEQCCRDELLALIGRFKLEPDVKDVFYWELTNSEYLVKSFVGLSVCSIEEDQHIFFLTAGIPYLLLEFKISFVFFFMGKYLLKPFLCIGR